MKGASFAGQRRVEFLEVPDPTPGPDDVVLAIRASGMCGSDLHYFRSASGAGGPVASASGAARVGVTRSGSDTIVLLGRASERAT